MTSPFGGRLREEPPTGPNHATKETAMCMMKRRLRPAALVLVFGLGAGALSAELVAVRYTEGVVRGFLVLRGPDGAVIANGDSIQFARAGRVTNRLVFHFRDGRQQERWFHPVELAAWDRMLGGRSA